MQLVEVRENKFKSIIKVYNFFLKIWKLVIVSDMHDFAMAEYTNAIQWQANSFNWTKVK